MDLLTTVLFVIAAYYGGKTLIAYLDYRHAVKSHNRNEVVSFLDGIIRNVKVETHNGVHYWFDGENDRFLAQGATNEEIYAIIKERFPNNVFILPEGSVLCAPDWTPVFGDKHVISHKISERFFE